MRGGAEHIAFFNMKRHDKQTDQIVVNDTDTWNQMQLDYKSHRYHISTIKTDLPAELITKLKSNYQRFRSLWEITIPMQYIKRFTPHGGAGYNSLDWDQRYNRLLQQYIQSDIEAIDQHQQ